MRIELNRGNSPCLRFFVSDSDKFSSDDPPLFISYKGELYRYEFVGREGILQYYPSDETPIMVIPPESIPAIP